MTAPSRVPLSRFNRSGRRALQWSIAALGTSGALAFLSNQLLLSHRASGKSVDWLQAAAWAIPTLLAWCVCLPLVLKLAAYRPVRIASVVGHLVAGLATCSLVLALHVGISWAIGWIPRDVSILPFEFAMTGRAYGGFNLLAYWSIVLWMGMRRPPPSVRAVPGNREDSIDPFVVKIGSRKLLVPLSDVRWVEAAGNYVRLHTDDRTHLVRMSLKTLAERLDPHAFVRIHRSVVVRRSAVRALKPRASGDYDVTLADGTRVMLSRRFRTQALPKLTDGGT